MSEAITEGTRQWSMPAADDWIHRKPALPHDAVPIDRHLGMAAENVGRKQFLGDSLLAGVDDLGLRHGRGDLLDVFRFHRVAKDDANRHGVWSGWGVE